MREMRELLLEEEDVEDVVVVVEVGVDRVDGVEAGWAGRRSPRVVEEQRLRDDAEEEQE